MIKQIIHSGIYLNRIIALTENGEVLCGKYTELDSEGESKVVDKIKWDVLHKDN